MDEPPRSGAKTAVPKSAPQSDTSRDIAAEEFLFHLYRGSELLQDSRVHEAKEELEHALLLQPRDPKGQDLLATVYFRIGLYPRAIQIYELLLRDSPNDTSLKLNLALCHLKTGQADLARGELEDVVRANPAHRRAWGYLGLAYERLGDHEKAEAALDRGGHANMARRIAERRGRPSFAVPQPEDLSRESIAVRAAAAKAVEEIETRSFAVADPVTRVADASPWRAVEIGRASADAEIRSAPEPLAADPPPALTVPAARGAELAEALTHATAIDEIPRPPPIPSPHPSPRRSPPPAVAKLPSKPASVPALDGAASIDGAPSTEKTSALRIEGTQLHVALEGREVGMRLETLRAYSGALEASWLERRGRTPSQDAKSGGGEPLGGVVAPLRRVSGDGFVICGARPGRTLHLIGTHETEPMFVREELLFALDLTLTYETGKIARGDDEPLWLVQLRGQGAAVLDVTEAPRSIDVTAARPVTVRVGSLVGWIGRLVPRALAPGEAPASQHGLVTLSGEGSVLVSPR